MAGQSWKSNKITAEDQMTELDDAEQWEDYLAALDDGVND